MRVLQVSKQLRVFRGLTVGPGMESSLHTIPGYAAARLGAAGKPPSCLLLHGFTGARGDWSLWPPDAPPALAIDLPGHGESPDPYSPFAVEVSRLLTALPAGIDSVCGYSLGGRIALALLRAAPRRFRTAVIISAHPGLRSEAQRAARRHADRYWIDLLRQNGLRSFVDQWERQPLFSTQCNLSPTVIEAQRARRLAQRSEGLARSLEAFGLAEQADYIDALVAFSGTVHWVVGAEDPKFLGLARDLAQLRPTTTLHELAGVGHNPLLESPEALAELLSEILAPR